MSLTIVAEGPCRTLILDRPQAGNALSADLIDRLADAVADAAQSGAEVLILRGNGRNFCAGFDFAGIEHANDAQLLQRFIRIELLLQALLRSPCRTVACAQGAAYGAGADLFAACQSRLAAPGTRFRFPGLAFGVVLGTHRLGELIGSDRARELLASLRALEASEALAMGLVGRIVEQSEWVELPQHELELARRLPLASTTALAHALASRDGDRRLADLVRSAARPGLKERMTAYWQAQQKG
jgi:enoyl-CoA hydratase/carnithine racemase